MNVPGLIGGAMVEHQGLRLKKGAAAQAGVSQLLFSLIEQCLPSPSICQAQPDHPPAQLSQSLFPRQVDQIVWYKEQCDSHCPALLVWSKEGSGIDLPLLFISLVPSAQSDASSHQEAKNPQVFHTPKYEELCFVSWHLIDSFSHLRISPFEM